MADPNAKTLPAIVQGFAASVQAAASGLVDFSTGSIVRAISQAQAGIALWLQGLVLIELARTRLSTSPTDADADSFVADFFGPFADGVPASFRRLGAVSSVGTVTFSRFTASGVAVVPAPDPATGLGGATVATQDGTQRFVVALDTANPAYNAGLGGYVMANGIGSVSVTANSLTTGAATNVIGGAINTITSPIPGVDSVTNASAFNNGQDTEATVDFENRFRARIAALREATPPTILSYVLGLRPGVKAVNVEGVNPDGSVHKGFFYVIVDDGTGSPTSTLLNAARAVIDQHRADGIEFSVIAPTVVTANVIFGLTSTLIDASVDRVIAIAAVRAYINSLDIGQKLFLTRLYQVAYDASPTITDITALTINGSAADLAAPLPDVVKAGTVSST